MDEAKWLEICDEDVNVEQIEDVIRRRVAARRAAEQAGDQVDAEELAHRLYRQMVTDQTIQGHLSADDCDILPRDYDIAWRIPILGPIHAAVRRVVNAEIRRYLEAGLLRQSRINRTVLQELDRLSRENQALRERLESLQNAREGGASDGHSD